MEFNMFEVLEKLGERPEPFEFYTADALWCDEHISKQMLETHLNEDIDLASRKKEFIEKSVDWIANRFGIGEGAKICDFGCGPGLYSTRFAERGAQVTGIDFSERSINHARKTAEERGLDINYVRQNYLDFATDEKFDLITMIYVDFCPLSPGQRSHLLGTFHEILKDSGHIFMDVISLNFFDAAEEARSYEYAEKGGFWSARPYHMFMNSFKYETEKLLLNKHTVFEAERTREIYNWLQCFSPESLKAEFAAGGLRIIEQYSDVAGTHFSPDSNEFAVVVEKI